MKQLILQQFKYLISCKVAQAFQIAYHTRRNSFHNAAQYLKLNVCVSFKKGTWQYQKMQLKYGNK